MEYPCGLALRPYAAEDGEYFYHSEHGVSFGLGHAFRKTCHDDS